MRIQKREYMIHRLTKFGVVGIVATVSHYLVALSLSKLVGVFCANAVGYAGGMCVSYIGHHNLTFAGTKGALPHHQAISRFVAASAIGFITSQGILYLAVSLLHLPDWLGLGLVVIAVPIITFLLYQFWVFAPSPKKRIS